MNSRSRQTSRLHIYPRHVGAADVSRPGGGSRSTRSIVAAALSAVGVVALVAGGGGSHPVAAQAAPPDLGTSANFAVLAASTVTNTGPSIISGDLGVWAGTAIAGFPPGVVNGAQHAGDDVAGQAQTDVITGYNDAAGATATVANVGADLVGQTLFAGVYRNDATGTLGLTGTVTLDAQGDPNAIFIFQSESSLITGSSSTVALINGASSCNVYWQVGSSATFGTATTFKGTVMALTSITATTGTNVRGRLLARNGAVTLDTNTINSIGCEIGPTVAPPTTSTSSTVPETTAPETTAPGTTAPETTAPETTAPETTAPATTAPGTTAPETTAPGDSTTVPGGTLPGDTVPGPSLPTPAPGPGPGLPVTGSSATTAPFVIGVLAVGIGGVLQLSVHRDRRRRQGR